MQKKKLLQKKNFSNNFEFFLENFDIKLEKNYLNYFEII